MSKILDPLIEQGCKIQKNYGSGNMLKCSESYVQKFPDKPWTVLMKMKGMEPFREKLLNTNGIGISGIGIGSIDESGAWSKIDKFTLGNRVYLYILDEDLKKSRIKDPSLKRSVERTKRLSEMPFVEDSGLDMIQIAKKELENIASNVEVLIEESYSKNIGNTMCKADSDVQRVWTPSNNDMMNFSITVECALPKKFMKDLKDTVESIGRRQTFKTVHRNGINSILTPNEDMFLRKILIHDKKMEGPFLSFGVRDRRSMSSEDFVPNIKVLEKQLSKM